MELNNDIEVNAPIDHVWDAFNDVERIAPCLPGAQLQEIEGEEHRGIVKVKVGPITAQYKGKAIFLERNHEDWKVVIKGDGRDTRGAGNASALITATLHPVSDEITKIDVHTDLTITGKVAQFGRGAIADVSSKLMGQFAENLEALLDETPAEAPAEQTDVAADTADATVSAATTDATVAAAAPAGTTSTVRKINSPEPEAVDLLDVAGTPMLKRIAVPAAVILLLLILRRILSSGD
ncbi:MAG: SRPBCC family protein [Acidimicrobiales bacterium]